MKIGENDTNIFEDGNEKILGDVAAKYFVIKKGFADGTLEIYNEDKKEKVTGPPPTDTNYMRAFEQLYKITFADLETFLEIREYYDNEWNAHIEDEIARDFANGAKFIKEK